MSQPIPLETIVKAIEDSSSVEEAIKKLGVRRQNISYRLKKNNLKILVTKRLKVVERSSK